MRLGFWSIGPTSIDQNIDLTHLNRFYRIDNRYVSIPSSIKNSCSADLTDFIDIISKIFICMYNLIVFQKKTKLTLINFQSIRQKYRIYSLFFKNIQTNTAYFEKAHIRVQNEYNYSQYSFSRIFYSITELYLIKLTFYKVNFSQALIFVRIIGVSMCFLCIKYCVWRHQ